MLPHQPQNALLVDRQLFHKVQVGTESTIALERVRSLELLDAWEQLGIMLDDLQ
jgi:hypothetical protein